MATLEQATEDAIDTARAKAEIEIKKILERLQADTFRRVYSVEFYGYSTGGFELEISLSGDER